MLRTATGLLVAALVPACDDTAATTAPVEAVASARPVTWEQFRQERPRMLAQLGEPVEACVQQLDTESSAFHGCYDWHSAVHGVWALYALARLEGDPRWASRANGQLTYQAIDAVRAELASGSLDAELPYGFAWFLLLAIERERATGANDLRAVAAEVADRLRAHMEGLDAAGWQEGLESDDYRNLSWALLNLWRHAQYTGESETQAWAEQMARDHLLTGNSGCSLRRESYDVDDFFAPCLMRVHTLVEMLPAAQVRPWAASFIGRDAVIEPLTEIAAPHPGGLNFSRAWGLWSLFRVTGNVAWRDAYVDHVSTHLAHPQYWREDYRSFSHWVPQFGVYAIALSWDQP